MYCLHPSSLLSIHVVLIYMYTHTYRGQTLFIRVTAKLLPGYGDGAKAALNSLSLLMWNAFHFSNYALLLQNFSVPQNNVHFNACFPLALCPF